MARFVGPVPVRGKKPSFSHEQSRDSVYPPSPDSERSLQCHLLVGRAENKIKHCRIRQEGHLYTIDTAEFKSLVELVNYYEKHTFYRKVKLKYPVTEKLVRRIGGLGVDERSCDKFGHEF
ncbi:hypothetical protein AVEN_165840-1 [Araneus ventricosus]|uniref:SH2 domain-containing protein n=1 Tax=Araneus ventricosus TaxID=182803 RepID=A0A4Y2RT33_ARAVE|nr:hypothetical protein AVEN_165840-1 [Araneus ventricosus]